MSITKRIPALCILALMASVSVAAPSFEEQYQQGLAAFNRDDKPQALKILKPLAEQGHVASQQKLAVIYAMGIGGVAKNSKEAVKWYLKAAEGGNAEAQHQLATAYRNGDYGLTRDYAQALKWFRAAADQGHASARLSLAVMQQNGWGTEKNPQEALRLARLAAEQGNADAQVQVGRMYEKGEGVAQSYAEAAKWYRMAADQGSYMGQSYLKSLPAIQNAQPAAAQVSPAQASVAVARTATAAPVAAPASVAPAPAQKTLVQTPITDPARFLAERNSQAAASAARPVSDRDFGLDKAPADVRGISRPIGGNAAYGHSYTDQQGLYTFVLAQGWSWEANKVDRRAVDFWGKSGANAVACTVTPMDYWRGPKSLVELQAVPEHVVRATFEQGLIDSLGWKAVDNRGTLMISDGRSPVRAWSWSAVASDGKSNDTVAVVETPANALVILCSSNKPKLPDTVIKLAFRLAEGALVPGGVATPSLQVAWKPALAVNAGQPGTLKSIIAEGRNKLGWMQQQSASAGVNRAADERLKLQAEFDSALARKDRDAIYRIGPKLKHDKFCLYVYNDPSATRQQLYDGASSCQAGPMFDKLTQRYIEAITPLASPVNSYSTPSNSAYSAPSTYTQPAYDPYQVKRSMDYEIRQMNKRIDDAGR